MYPRLMVIVLGLLAAGCAQSRSAMPSGPGKSRGEPVGMDPVPSLNDTINKGMGNPAVVQATLPDPSNPRWNGQVGPAAAQLARNGSGPPGRADSAAAAPAATRWSPPPGGAPAGLVMEAAPTAGALPPVAETPTGPAGLPPAPVATASSPAGQPVASGSQPPPAATDSPTDVEVTPSSAALPPLPALPAEAPPAQAPPEVANPTPAPATQPSAAPIQNPAAAPAPAAPNPEGGAPVSGPADPTAGGPAQGQPPDPLLGPNPDLMPGLEAAPPQGPPSAEPKPPGPSAAASTGPAPLDPAPALMAGGDLPLEPAPARSMIPDRAPADDPGRPRPRGSLVPDIADSGLSPSPGREGKSDSGIKQVSFAGADPASSIAEKNWREAGRTAARVGNEVITLHDLVQTVKDQLKRRPPQQQLSKAEVNMIAKSILSGMIERSLLCQEAKRMLKNPKQMDRILEAADKSFREEELPPLMRRYMVENEGQLKQKLQESGRSLEAMNQNYRQEFLAQVFLHQKLSEKLSVDLNEMLKYYSEHVRDKEFDRSAEITWREILVEVAKYPSKAEARKKAESLLTRLTKGEDFASLARAESDGPSSIRAQGGLMQTAPGSYAVPAVNESISTLGIGKVSAILEGPTSFHIVRVENRRAAGPASFEEIQSQIRQRIHGEKLQQARVALLTKLKQNTIVTTIFDGTESDPNTAPRY